MSNTEKQVFEVTAIVVDEDGEIERSWKIEAPYADELADVVRDMSVDFCPIAFDVPEQNIDYRLPQDRIEFRNDVYNFLNRLY